MGYAYLKSAQIEGSAAIDIGVEVHVSRGIHSFSIVGMTSRAVTEAGDRISSAILNSGYKSPKQSNQKIVIALSPAEINKHGSHFDLSMALGYLIASKQIDAPSDDFMAIGELALSGKIKKVSGIIAFIRNCAESGIKNIIIPEAYIPKGIYNKDINILLAKDLNHAVSILKGDRNLINTEPPVEKEISRKYEKPKKEILLENIVGHEEIKRKLIVAMAGRHNLLLWGPPGTGKSMLAKACASILPNLNETEQIEVTNIHSIAGISNEKDIEKPPFRSPHHTSTYSAIIGGVKNPIGEITLAHKGILFLDEITEFDMRVIESLREPLEEKSINLARADFKQTLPADFICIATMNPCPCGKRGVYGENCTCTPLMINRYKRKISEPILDRFDMCIEVFSVEYKYYYKEKSDEIPKNNITSALAKKLIKKVRETNLEKVRIDPGVSDVLIKFAENNKLSGRSIEKIKSISKTIAVLENFDHVKEVHMLEAIQYRARKL